MTDARFLKNMIMIAGASEVFKSTYLRSLLLISRRLSLWLLVFSPRCSLDACDAYGHRSRASGRHTSSRRQQMRNRIRQQRQLPCLDRARRRKALLDTRECAGKSREDRLHQHEASAYRDDAAQAFCNTILGSHLFVHKWLSSLSFSKLID
ncbi:hypothetical protein Plhal304r1_c057g0143851 [Plasmopara halstedii]